MKSVTSLLSLTEVSEETTRDQQVVNHVCEQFMMFYMDKCIRDLVCDRKWVILLYHNYIVDVYNIWIWYLSRWHLKEYRNVFCGNEMVDWLLLMGLARDRNQAEKYGQGLLDGGIINHVDGRKDFHDQSYFYSFAQCDWLCPFLRIYRLLWKGTVQLVTFLLFIQNFFNIIVWCIVLKFAIVTIRCENVLNVLSILCFDRQLFLLAKKKVINVFCQMMRLQIF